MGSGGCGPTSSSYIRSSGRLACALSHMGYGLLSTLLATVLPSPTLLLLLVFPQLLRLLLNILQLLLSLLLSLLLPPPFFLLALLHMLLLLVLRVLAPHDGVDGADHIVYALLLQWTSRKTEGC